MLQSDCLLIVDFQNDFCTGGSLAVKEGDAIVEPINRLMKSFSVIGTTQDWHPPNHCSFKEQGGIWPPHCIQNTLGAELHPRLDKQPIQFRILKAQCPEKEAYSGFDGSHLDEELKKRHIRRIFIAGLTTDYCVRTTALDGLRLGYETVVLKDLIRAVNLKPGDGENALNEVSRAGALIAHSKDIKKGEFLFAK